VNVSCARCKRSDVTLLGDFRGPGSPKGVIIGPAATHGERCVSVEDRAVRLCAAVGRGAGVIAFASRGIATLVEVCGGNAGTRCRHHA
jgi:hypothetical protein